MRQKKLFTSSVLFMSWGLKVRAEQAAAAWLLLLWISQEKSHLWRLPFIRNTVFFSGFKLAGLTKIKTHKPTHTPKNRGFFELFSPKCLKRGLTCFFSKKKKGISKIFVHQKYWFFFSSSNKNNFFVK